jgi:tetratricopeptide (TPR) repeat protein
MKHSVSKAVVKAAFFIGLVSIIIASSCKNSSTDQKVEGSTEKTDSIAVKDSIVTLQDLNQMIREDPLNPMLYAQRAAYRAINKEFNEAINDISLAVKLDSLNDQFYIMQAEYYIYNGQPNSAKKGLNDCLRLFPNNADVMLKMAEIHLYLQEYSQAQRILRNVTTLNPDIAQIYFLNGLVFLEKQDTLNAINNLQFATEKDPDFYAAYMELGRVHSLINSPLAVDYFKSAIELIPDSYEARYNLGMYYQDHEMIREAEMEYNYIIYEIDSTSADPFYNLGYINLIYLSEFDKAIDYFTRAIQKEPEYVEAWYNRGFTYEVMGKLKLARENYQRSLLIEPNYPLSIKGINRIDEGNPFKI